MSHQNSFIFEHVLSDLALPDPPMDVRVDGGPQDGTILVTWIPSAGTHTVVGKQAPVTGYAVFADGKRVTDVDSPSSKNILKNAIFSLAIQYSILLIIFSKTTNFIQFR